MKARSQLKAKLILILLLSMVTCLMATGDGNSGNVISTRPKGPGDIYTAAGFPCVTAHSTTRALFAAYDGPLYQVKRQSDGKTLDIGVVPPSQGDSGGYANAAAQDAFCANTMGWITTIYDQSGLDNHLVQAPPGTFTGPAKGGFNTLPIADMAPVTLGGNKVYGVYIMPGMGLRNNNARGLAINDEPQGIYMVFDGTHYDSGCCFNYGNTSTNSRAVGRGTMDTVYFGTATAWGRGSSSGPWIMSDMEAGLFSGYETKVNEASPTIDGWRFVTGSVNGGGRNWWDLRGGNAQQGELSVFYRGPRPGSKENDNYYPMHRKGAVQMGNGGDNGNGSAGTFYEGIMVLGYPTDDAVNAVQANIVAARYDVQRVSLSRVTTFTPGSTQEVTVTFTNTTGATAWGVELDVSVPAGWTSTSEEIDGSAKKLAEPTIAGASVSRTFKVTSPSAAAAGYLTANVQWVSRATGQRQKDTQQQRIRNAPAIKINEVRFSTGNNATDQFIELYNAAEYEVDLSGWTLINTQSEWAPVTLATIDAGTQLASKGFYLLGLAGSGLTAPVQAGATTIHVNSIEGLTAGQRIVIDDEMREVKGVGTAAAPMSTLFVPVSTGPWLTFPAGATNLPVTSVTGFEAGQKIGIDVGGDYEVATVTAVGKASTQTQLVEAAQAGDTHLKLRASANLTAWDTLTINTGLRKELVTVKRVIRAVEAPTRRAGATENVGEVELTQPLTLNHAMDVDVSCPGSGISFTPATRFAHQSGDAVQALGSGLTLDRPLSKGHAYGAAVINEQVNTAGYQGGVKPHQWYGGPLSSFAGSLALMDPTGKVVVDAMVYGSQQSNSSGNGTITSPELATLEGIQSQGGCIVVAPNSGRDGRGRRFAATRGPVNQSVGRFPDGLDTDSNCDDIHLSTNPTPGATNFSMSNP